MSLNYKGWQHLADDGVGLEKLQALTYLNLNFRDCEQLSDVGALGAGLEKLQALTSLNLNFTGCE